MNGILLLVLLLGELQVLSHGIYLMQAKLDIIKVSHLILILLLHDRTETNMLSLTKEKVSNNIASITTKTFRFKTKKKKKHLHL